MKFTDFKITEYIIKIGLEAIKNKGISLEKEKIIKQRLISFIEHQHQVNISCTLEEEIDFAQLSNYICTELPSDIEVCLFGEKKIEKYLNQPLLVMPYHMRRLIRNFLKNAQ